MALLTLSIYNSMGDLIPFMLLFFIFILIFGLIGHALYGPLLLEFATFWASIRTVIDMLCGNYVFSSIELGLNKGGDNEAIDYAVAVIYFYVFFFLMMLIVLNIIIAILMDGYATVKEDVGSTVEKQLKYNVGDIGPKVMEVWKKRIFFWRHGFIGRVTGRAKFSVHEPWSDERWGRDFTIVSERRRQAGLTANSIRLGQLIAELRALPTSRGEDIAWQVHNTYHGRIFVQPSNINTPFEEPDVEGQVKAVNEIVMGMEVRHDAPHPASLPFSAQTRTVTRLASGA